MNIVFTYYPLKVQYSHACALLAQVCRNAGIHAYIVPMDHGFKEKVASINPEYIGFSFTTVHEYRLSMPYIYEAKSTKAMLLTGGVYLRSGGTVIDGLFDFVCRGEGETLPNFLLAGDMTVFDVPQREENIDLLPDYSCVTGFEFDRGIPYFSGKKIIPYSSSRGCPYKCHFCLAKGQNGPVRIKTTIRNDLHGLYERFTPDLFYIMDELPPYYNEHWRNQMEGNKYPFCCYIRCDIKAEHLIFLIQNGMKYCVFGVETGDEAQRINLLGKTITDTQILNTVKLLKDNNIPYVAFYMIGAPGETDITRAKTAYMKELVGGFPVTWLYEDLFGCVQKTIRCSEKDTPLVYHVLRETGGPYQATNQLCTDPSIITLMPNDGSVFLAFQINETTCSGHVFVLPKYRGSRAEQAEREAIRWVINNTQYKTVLGFTKQKDRHIIDFHKRVGMKEVCAIDDQVIFAWENK